MKKSTSLLLAMLMICTVLSVFALPAFAADKPAELDVSSGKISIKDGGVYIISSGDHSVSSVNISGGTLIIGKDATVTVTNIATVTEKGTVVVLGTLDFKVALYPANLAGKVFVDGGDLTGYYSGTFTKGHAFENGICVGCGYECPHTNDFENGKCRDCGHECPHTNGFENGKCRDCGYECPHTNGFENGTCRDCGYECSHTNGFANGKCRDCGAECMHSHTKTVCGDCGLETESAVGSTLSEGNMTIVVGIACAVIFGLGGFFIGSKKKKTILAGGVENKDKE